MKPGVYQMSADAYHGHWPSLSSTGARQILNECPARFFADRQNPPEPTEALDTGTAAHEYLLEGEKWPQKFVLLPEDHDGRTKAGKERVAEIVAAGKRPLKEETFATIQAMRDALMVVPYVAKAFSDGRAEQSLFWHDQEFGITCRARFDFLPNTLWVIPDYKTTRSAEPDYLRKAMWDYGYHQQAEWYTSGARTLGLMEDPAFLFVFQEKQPPYLVTPVTPDPTALQWAEIQNRKAKEVFARCMSSGIWPGYTDKVLTLDLPVWAAMKLQERHEQGLFEVAYKMQAPLENSNV